MNDSIIEYYNMIKHIDDNTNKTLKDFIDSFWKNNEIFNKIVEYDIDRKNKCNKLLYQLYYELKEGLQNPIKPYKNYKTIEDFLKVVDF